MSIGRVVGVVLAVVMILGGGFLAIAGMGYIGQSGDTSQSWSTIGAVIAGLGVALAIVTFRPRQ